MDSLEKDLDDEKHKTGNYERICYEFEGRVKALEAKLRWWEGKDREQRRAAVQIERRKQEDMEIERKVKFEEEIRDRVRRDLDKKRKLEEYFCTMSCIWMLCLLLMMKLG